MSQTDSAYHKTVSVKLTAFSRMIDLVPAGADTLIARLSLFALW